MIEYIKDNSILIIPSCLKNKILKEIRTYNKEYNIKIYNLDEFITNLTFGYDEKTIYNVMKLENVNYEIAKLYLDNLKFIFTDSKIDKIHNLFLLKDKIDNYLIKNNLFHLLIKNKDINIYGYDYINKFHKYILNNINNVNIIEKKYNYNNHDVYKFSTLENEIIFIAEKISELISSGISLDKIFIANLNNEYYPVLKRVFKMYNIPININNEKNIYQTAIGKYFINNLSNDINLLMDNIKNTFDLENKNNKKIYNILVDLINKFYFTEDYLSIKENIIAVMNKTYIENECYDNAINSINLINNIIEDDEYVFIVNFNLNKIPVTYKDEDYLNDDIKFDYMEKSYELNQTNKELYHKIISNIKNVIITFKEKHLNESFYPSLLIDEYNMNVIDKEIKISKYSDEINKLLLTKSLDNLLKFNIKEDNLRILYNNYKIDYMTYDNRFNGLDKNLLYNFLKNKFDLSYSSMDNYYHCAFKFYLSNILKLNCFEDTIQTYIGNLFHYVLSKAFDSSFEFDSTINYFIKNNPYPKSNKSLFFLNKLIDELKFIIFSIKYQNTFMNMNEAFYEKKISVEKNNVININFKGFIDKILKKDNKLVVIDYKTYMVDINLKYLPYGLSMQLPVYLYLSKNLNKDYEIIGFYLQQVLFGNFSKEKDKTIKELKLNNLKLKGYSLGNEAILSDFDSSLENSELIHGMKLTNKGFGPYSKVLTQKQINNIINITDQKIDECIEAVVNANFDINPKKINNENIGCKYCKYKDICFMTQKDIVELQDIKDLEFLE